MCARRADQEVMAGPLRSDLLRPNEGAGGGRSTLGYQRAPSPDSYFCQGGPNVCRGTYINVLLHEDEATFTMVNVQRCLAVPAMCMMRS